MKLLVSTLEASAHLHLKAVDAHLDNVEYLGIFDKSLGTPIHEPKEFSVMGFSDALAKYSMAKRAIKRMVELSWSVDKVLLIDAPAFNLPLAKAIKKVNPHVEIIYYILPKAWAWKRRRIKSVEKYTDKQLSIFPFESKFYTHATYVGNPLMDELPLFKQDVTHSNTLVYMPGSRKSEIRALMPIFRLLQKSYSDKKALLVIPEYFSNEEREELYGDITMFDTRYNTYEALEQAEYAFVCSGTATLESALIGTPLTLVYIAKKWEYRIAKLLVKLPYVGLANLLFWFDNKPHMHDEFLQEAVTVENLQHSMENMDKTTFLDKSHALRAHLGEECSQNVAKILLS